MENFVDVESKFSSHLTKLFLAPATCTARADLWSCELVKDVHYNSKILAEELRYTVILIHVRVALICSCGKRTEAMANIKLDKNVTVSFWF